MLRHKENIRKKKEQDPTEKLMIEAASRQKGTNTSKAEIIVQEKEEGKEEMICFENVDIYSPTGALLVRNLNFQVEKGKNVLVGGPNGSGKSSLFRILGNLWPLCSGTIRKPSDDKLFYVPQQPYLVPGTLRDQVIYPEKSPETKEELEKQTKKINQLMELVELTYLIDREGWDNQKDWFDVLSGGEKQRVAMSRLFYHCPAFGILDECTSAVSTDVEAKIYQRCKESGITIFTVGHRPQLKHHHDYMLRFDGEGGWEWIYLSKERLD
jgi:ATP-binding cassette subfamily D (ALD) protein 3